MDTYDAFLRDLEAVYRSDFHRFLRVAEGICGDLDAARDAVQDGFARAIRFRATFRGESPLEGWIWTIVVNAARKAVTATPAFERGPEVAAGNGRAAEAELGELIATLPERQRLVLFLHYYADLDYSTIAESLGIAPGTVGATLNAARAALRAELEEVGHG